MLYQVSRKLERLTVVCRCFDDVISRCSMSSSYDAVGVVVHHTEVVAASSEAISGESRVGLSLSRSLSSPLSSSVATTIGALLLGVQQRSSSHSRRCLPSCARARGMSLALLPPRVSARFLSRHRPLRVDALRVSPTLRSAALSKATTLCESSASLPTTGRARIDNACRGIVRSPLRGCFPVAAVRRCPRAALSSATSLLLLIVSGPSGRFTSLRLRLKSYSLLRPSTYWLLTFSSYWLGSSRTAPFHGCVGTVLLSFLTLLSASFPLSWLHLLVRSASLGTTMI